MDLFTKAAELGIQTGFHDGQGHWHTTDEAALKIILDAMPVRTQHRFLTGPVVVRAEQAERTFLTDAASFPLKWEIIDGVKVLAEGETADRSILWPLDLPVGVWRVRLTDASLFSEEAPVIVAPAKAFPGEFERSWILAVQLYGLRSERNWGIGDFTDLQRLIEMAASLGAGGVGLNPLHALFDDRPAECSPYSPNSRLFLNPLYIDVEALHEFAATDSGDTLARLRASPQVEYAAVAAAKSEAMRAAFEIFNADPASPRQVAFAAFRAERAPLLTRFACFEMLRHKYQSAWWDWPEEFQHPDDDQCARLRAGHDAKEVAYIEYVQWNADLQLKACHDLTARLGMKVGLYLDVAVGVQSGGFDAWNEQVAVSRHLSIGAPPDLLQPAGQNWGLAGFNGAGLETNSFVPFKDMLRASMRYAGAIRLDHVLGLNRLYVVPHGYSAANGAYVKMPLQALLAVTAQESVANHCVVIGEDLGTVPDGFRDELADWGVWSYLVMMFERDSHAAFRDLGHYATNALVTFNTHDLPTFAGWRSYADLVLKRSLGIDPGESDDARRYAIEKLGDILRQHGIDHADLDGVIRFLSLTSTRMLAIGLEDLLGVVDQPNIPGTIDEHPNWRQRLPVAVDEIAEVIDAGALRSALHERSGEVA
ncbi:4-alpha-glucanotransferase [Tardiphaga sp. vice352]|uniref:4-alpha-glucanotransferase n=1 Tax=unclassified Tardiphaga TaxID=2631404 RepID=UPI001163AE13|nr:MULTISPECIES: 4-alpha-glucanotransferase [unclassified Tardiphaga]QDM16160.1 4-alpha-glucanotransferase [Tardiphaga sp. vice278]QDM21187.1 4-alpha-glucanotransferase [Tardiphaga sp. vice154]QDM26369.1 4-alpha-glucanotransferase [Tardiphaga sp. vice304]QDM31437.1 4-alpha-glucanotransferase [Tardiphaga sp. vice352]